MKHHRKHSHRNESRLTLVVSSPSNGSPSLSKGVSLYKCKPDAILANLVDDRKLVSARSMGFLQKSVKRSHRSVAKTASDAKITAYDEGNGAQLNTLQQSIETHEDLEVQTPVIKDNVLMQSREGLKVIFDTNSLDSDESIFISPPQE